MKRAFQVTYEWWKDAERGEAPRSEHIEALEERACGHITSMIAEGYMGGDMSTSVHVDDQDPESGVRYRGWWDRKNVEVREDTTLAGRTMHMLEDERGVHHYEDTPDCPQCNAAVMTPDCVTDPACAWIGMCSQGHINLFARKESQ